MFYKNKNRGYAVLAMAIMVFTLSSCSSEGHDAQPVNAADPSVTFQTQAAKDSDLGKGIQSTAKSDAPPVDNHLEIPVPTKNNTDVSQNETVRFLIPNLTTGANLNSYIYYNESGINSAKIPVESKITGEQGYLSARITIPASIDKGKYVIAFEKVISGISENDNNYKAEVYSAPITVK